MDANQTTEVSPSSSNAFSSYPYQREFEVISAILTPIQFALLLVGLFSNTVNIIVFIKSGVKNSVSTLFLALSLSDCAFLILFTPSTVRGAFSKFGLTQMTVLSTIHYLLFWPAFTMYDYSSYISVFLGVTRCACVAMPLRFKTVFTTKRTILALCALFCVSVLVHLPMLTVFRLGLVTNPATNTTSLGYVRDETSLLYYKQKINDILNKNIIPWITFIVMVACVALLSFNLFQSSKIRSKPSGNHDASQACSSQSSETKEKKAQSHKLSSKDLKVAQSVVLVCSIFIGAQLPSLIYTAVRTSNEEFSGRGRLLFLAAMCIQISYIFYFLNATVNIFVYYNYNSKYRHTCRSLFGLHNSKENSKTLS